MMNSEPFTASAPDFDVTRSLQKPGHDRAATLPGRLTREGLVHELLSEETLVVDDRSAVSPAQMVENKLTRMLKEASLPVSHLQMRGLLRKR